MQCTTFMQAYLASVARLFIFIRNYRSLACSILWTCISAGPLLAMDLQTLKKEKPQLFPPVESCNLIDEPGYVLNLEKQELVSLDGIAHIALGENETQWQISNLPHLIFDKATLKNNKMRSWRIICYSSINL